VITEMRAIIVISLGVIAAAAACVPVASAAKPKLYAVSLKGDVRNEATRVRDDAVPPRGCMGTTSETHRFVASAGLAPKPSGAPVASYGRLRFRAQLTSPSIAASTTTAGSLEPDPYDPPPDASTCSGALGTKSWPCNFSAAATRRSGAEFALLPHGSKYELYYNRSDGLVSCDDEFPLGWSLLEAGIPQQTKLRVRAVKRLRKGRSTSASGTATKPPQDPETTGAETLRYTLKVERVR
jgi:hypothetical protein